MHTHLQRIRATAPLALVRTHDRLDTHGGTGRRFAAVLLLAASWIAFAPAAALSQPALGGPVSFADVVEQVSPAVVNVAVESDLKGVAMPGGRGPKLPEDSPMSEFFRRFFGEDAVPFERFEHGPPGRHVRGLGSGFIVDPSGYVVTNNHVVSGAMEVKVTLNDGTSHSAKVVGRDEKTDLALMKIDVDEPLPAVVFGDSDAARVGDWVLTVGNPFGLGGTVNAGIISARGRDIQSGPYDDYLQIDAPINRGNSGGPLFNASGEVIGVNTAIFSPSGGNIGIGFAIPSSTARDVISALKAHGRVERGWLGVQIQPVTEEVAAALGIGDAKGALVAGVMEDTPALRAGLQNGDIILGVDGTMIEDFKELPRLIAATKAGSEVVLTISRRGTSKEVSVVIGSMPGDEVAMRDSPDTADGDRPSIGLLLAPLTDEVRSQQGVDRDTKGVFVAKVIAGSPADEAGIQAGSVISMVGQREVASPKELVDEIRAATKRGHPSVLLRVEQGGKTRFIVVPFKS